MRIAPQVVLTSEQRAKLEAYARGRRTPARAMRTASLCDSAMRTASSSESVRGVPVV